MSGTVIVNRSRRFFANVSRKQAREALGPLLAGFIPDVGNEVTRSQDRGAAIATLPVNGGQVTVSVGARSISTVVLTL
jgi:hypothetical protein